MEYRLSFSDSDFRRDIREKLEKILKEGSPNLNIDYLKIRNYVEQAINQIREDGNSALYWGLVKYGALIALSKIRELNKVTSQIGPVENRTRIS